MTANIFVYDEIGEQTTLQSVRSQYAMFKNPKDIVVHINSVGGDVMEGYAIHDYLRSLGKKVITKIEGKCYSIATVIALAGDERLMSPNSEFMIHNPWMNAGFGDAKHYKNVSNQLEKEEKKLAEFYVQKTGVRINEIIPMMDKETYLKYDEAVKYGFITGESTQLKAVAKLNMQTEKEEKVNKLFAFMESLFTGKKAMSDDEKAMDDDEMKAMIETELDTGTAVIIEAEEGDDLLGKEVFIMDEEGRVPAPDGTHTLVDGTVLEVQDGVIVTINPDAEAKKDEMEELAKMKEEMEALKKENQELKASKDKELQAKEESIVAMKKETEEKFSALQSTMKELKAMVISEDAPKPVNKKPVDAAPKPKHKFDSLIAK